MKILIITQKYGESEVGGRRWYLFSKSLISKGLDVDVHCFINLTNESDHVISFCYRWIHFLWSDNGHFILRLFSKFIRSVFPKLKHRLLRKWMRQIDVRKYSDYDCVIISVPSFELVELTRQEIFERYSGVLALDCRDPIYLAERYSIPSHSSVILNVSEKITLQTQELIGAGSKSTFDTIHNCMKPSNDNYHISAIENSERYLIFIGTLYSEIQKRFFEVLDYVITDYNCRNPLKKLRVKLYISLDKSYFQSKGIEVNTDIFELLNYAEGPEFERNIRMAVAGIIPLWPGRYEGYGTKFLDYLKFEKNFLVIQDEVWKSEFYEKFKTSTGIQFNDWNKETLGNKLEEILDSDLSINSNLRDEFSLDFNTQKLINVIEELRIK
jgi:hypothetical protein